MLICCIPAQYRPCKQKVDPKRGEGEAPKVRKLCANPDKFIIAQVGMVPPDKPLWAIKMIEEAQAMFVTREGKYNVIGVSEKHITSKKVLATSFCLFPKRRDTLRAGDIFVFDEDIRKPEDITQECLRICLGAGSSVSFKDGGVSKNIHPEREKEMVWMLYPSIEKE